MFFFQDVPRDAGVTAFNDAPHYARYARVCQALERVRGMRIAVHDARDVLKALCCLPRHPDAPEQIAPRLHALPTSFNAAKALDHADAYVKDANAAVPGEGVRGPLETLPLPARLLHAGLDAALGACEAEEPPAWPTEASPVVRCSVIARGGAKALAMARVAPLLLRALDALNVRAERTMCDLGRAESAAAAGMAEAGASDGAVAAGSDGDEAFVRALRHSLGASKHSCRVRAIREANAHVRALVALMADVGGPGELGGRRLFVAGDRNSRPDGGAAPSLFVPPDFEALSHRLGACDAERREFSEAMRAAIDVEGWPPPPSARRHRVSLDGPVGCHLCGGRFSRHWAFRGVCWACEERARAAGVCPYSRAATDAAAVPADLHPFCSHQRLCAACDGAAFRTCAHCRLAHGDGETVLALCAEIAPVAVFVDWDRTFCSTKCGASPLLGGHSLDEDLLSVAALHRTYVLTRNSHTDDIRSFLSERRVVVAGVCTTPKGRSKAGFIAATLGELGGSGVAVFVDDSVREVCDAQIAADTRVVRVLFQRGAI